MHSYSVDFIERRNIPFYIAAAAATYALKTIVDYFKFNFDTGAYIPSGFAAYGLIYILFDKYLWKFGALRRIGLVSTPDLSGVWSGELKSSLSDLTRTLQITVRIHQTWTAMRVTLDTDKSFSASEMSCIRAVSITEFEFRWEYRAESKEGAEPFAHRGVTNLRLQLREGKVQPEMRGDYYTQHGRDTNGTIFLKRTEP